MRKKLILPVLFVLFAACSSPMLEWIESPVETEEEPASSPGSGGGSGGGSGSPPVSYSSDKAITAFSFGISPEETDTIRTTPSGGKIPITVILPVGSEKHNLTPTIKYIGKSISPGSGIPQDFSSPVTYRVTAQDGSWLEYEVDVIVKTPASAELIWFDIKLPGSGSYTAEGDVVQGPGGGEVIVHVPSETPLHSLTAKIVHTGTLNGPGVSTGDKAEVITSPVDFSNPVSYTVTPEAGSAKTYTVTVIMDKSDVKAITAFSFGLGNEETIIIGGEPQQDGKYSILATVPVSEDISDLTPIVTYKGAAVSGPPDISDTRTVDFSVPVPITGGSGQDFSSPVTYRVTAEDGTFREYEVTVFTSDLNTGKEITGFYFSSPSAQGIINETEKTITVTVPAGTDPSSLAPAIYHTGASINPGSGTPRNFTNPVTYTVTARDGSTATYTVSVSVAKRSDKAITAFDFSNVGGETTVIGGTPVAGKIPIVVTVPSVTTVAGLTPVVTHTGASITGGGIPAGGPGTVTGSPSNFSGPVTYTVKAEDETTQDYSVTVVKSADPTLDATSNLASIDGFYFNNPNAVGVINQSAKTIAVTVPYGTDVTNLIPTIYFTGNIVVYGSIADTTTPPNSGPPVTPAMSSPAGFEATNFTSPVQYTVTPLSQSSAYTKTYTVTVNFGPPPPLSSVRAITFFTFMEVDDVDTTATISTVPDASGKYPVEVIVPEGTDLTDLTPIILYKGASIDGPGKGAIWGASGIAPYDPEIKGVGGSVAVDYTNPRTYRVTAENGAYSDYVVTVRKDDNNVKEITAFYFTNPAAIGVIDQNAKTITVSVPNGTNLAALRPTVSYTGVSLDPPSGSAVNFSSSVTYTVKARNNTAQPYTVRVIPKPATTKEITQFSLPAGAGVLETVIGSIPDPDGYIPISITVSDQSNISALRPTITHTGVTITPPGGTPQTAKPFTDSSRSFGTPQVYRVTAEDGSFKDYAVSVHASGGGVKTITGFVFKPENNPGKGLTTQVVGQIDQDTHTIEVKVPHTVDISGTLAPTITYLGASLGYGTSPGLPSQVDTNTGPAGQSDTFLDTPRDFSADRYYTVTAADTSIQEYTVKVTKIPKITISYESPKDDKFTTESFDQMTGLLTITIQNTVSFPLSNPSYTYGSPYGWYVDSVKQNVSSTQNTLVIKTTDFQPGSHQVTVSAKRSADNKNYTNVLKFFVQE
jgi:hypothetical protein